MQKRVRPRRDFDALEARRKKASRLFAEGKLKQAEIARRLGTTRTSVGRWFQAWKKEGASALRKAGRAGRKPRVTASDLRLLDRALREGPVAHGFSSELWTLPRVAKVLKEITGVTYHPGHVWRLLRGLNWSLQRPVRRAKERNEQAIRQWVAEEWPRVKKTPGDGAPGSSSSTRAESRTVRLSGEHGRQRGRRRS
jgi:transposase